LRLLPRATEPIPSPSIVNLVSQSLEVAIKNRDLAGVQDEFERITANVDSDPAAAATASCALLESMFKMYIADEGLAAPADESLLPLWKVVRTHRKLNAADVEDENLRKILSGVSSIVDGIAGLRTRISLQTQLLTARRVVL
jgi:hypothetical protein